MARLYKFLDFRVLETYESYMSHKTSQLNLHLHSICITFKNYVQASDCTLSYHDNYRVQGMEF